MLQKNALNRLRQLFKLKSVFEFAKLLRSMERRKCKTSSDYMEHLRPNGGRSGTFKYRFDVAQRVVGFTSRPLLRLHKGVSSEHESSISIGKDQNYEW